MNEHDIAQIRRAVVRRLQWRGLSREQAEDAASATFEAIFVRLGNLRHPASYWTLSALRWHIRANLQQERIGNCLLADAANPATDDADPTASAALQVVGDQGGDDDRVIAEYLRRRLDDDTDLDDVVLGHDPRPPQLRALEKLHGVMGLIVIYEWRKAGHSHGGSIATFHRSLRSRRGLGISQLEAFKLVERARVDPDLADVLPPVRSAPALLLWPKILVRDGITDEAHLRVLSASFSYADDRSIVDAGLFTTRDAVAHARGRACVDIEQAGGSYWWMRHTRWLRARRQAQG